MLALIFLISDLIHKELRKITAALMGTKHNWARESMLKDRLKKIQLFRTTPRLSDSKKISCKAARGIIKHEY